jgi:CBS domain-containing protein
MSKKQPLKCCCVAKLTLTEERFYRDKLRDARYAALADAEGFGQLCFALELLGSRLCGAKLGLGAYEKCLKCLASNSLNFDRFDALYRRVLDARNDAMHTGAYARNAAQAAVQLSLILEEGLMEKSKMTVADYMVTTPVYVEEWHTLGYARQLMLVNSFSYLPIFHGQSWQLISDIAMAKFFQRLKSDDRKKFEAQPIKTALGLDEEKRLDLIEVTPVTLGTEIGMLLKEKDHPGLWVVVNGDSEKQAKQLVGVLSPFELM